jgi:hypothetical protein
MAATVLWPPATHNQDRNAPEMSPDSDHGRPTDSLNTRLRADPTRIAAARELLAEIDRVVFAGSRKHTEHGHTALTARTIKGLFGRG